MRKTTIGILGALLSMASVSAFGQTPTVTNADLEKYRQERLKAERQLRENYEELGFPSPEELLAEEAKSRRERAAVVSELTQRDISEARAEQELSGSTFRVPAFTYPNPAFVDYGGRYAPAYYYYYFRGFDRYPGRYRKEPGRFRTFRRMWRNATRGNTVNVPRRRR